MKFALSTNWSNLRLESGEAIVDEALELGFDALELGFNTTAEQVRGIRTRLDELPVGSVHAFCPVPLSAPHGHPELYLLADFDEAMRALARVHVQRNIEFAASIGADAVVLHAGRVPCQTFLARNRLAKRARRGKKLSALFARELEALVPILERNKVVLGLENLPYLEGFPDECEMASLAGPWVKPWLDTGHAFVREKNGWARFAATAEDILPFGLHLNDSKGGDDHLPPGEGLVDFAALESRARQAQHLVFEPNPAVTAEALRNGLAHLRRLWNLV